MTLPPPHILMPYVLSLNHDNHLTSEHVPQPELNCSSCIFKHLQMCQPTVDYVGHCVLARNPFVHFVHRAVFNQEKNRYGDVLCLDQTRVRLKPRRNEVSVIYVCVICVYIYIC